MLVSPEGIKFVSEDKLFRQLSDCFFEIEHVSLPYRFSYTWNASC
jgi:hypothetical protein